MTAIGEMTHQGNGYEGASGSCCNGQHRWRSRVVKEVDVALLKDVGMSENRPFPKRETELAHEREVALERRRSYAPGFVMDTLVVWISSNGRGARQIARSSVEDAKYRDRKGAALKAAGGSRIGGRRLQARAEQVTARRCRRMRSGECGERGGIKSAKWRSLARARWVRAQKMGGIDLGRGRARPNTRVEARRTGSGGKGERQRWKARAVASGVAGSAGRGPNVRGRGEKDSGGGIVVSGEGQLQKCDVGKRDGAATQGQTNASRGRGASGGRECRR
ncbi:hypothetical protein DFH08DRAFT_825323 [Mycena albidolilacea]|uniref:Uncharacterized protein n=1 Tax=Mycena albidolilacea TaxID=1033008 RepID=A0AAD6Z307_9AGAR|nr:hypothetical protein DFH08DRAFT_825323 [Mycena albidolilacea]